MKARIKKAYYVEIVDDDNTVLKCDYCFGNKENAIKQSKAMIKEVENQEYYIAIEKD